MDKWTDLAVLRITAAAKNDPCYQSLLRRCEQAELLYQTVSAKLTEEDRRIVEEYIALCDQMQYRLTQLAYFCEPIK